MTRQRAAHASPPRAAIAASYAAFAAVVVLFAVSVLGPASALAQDPFDPAPYDSLPFVDSIAIGPAGEPGRPPLPRPLCPTDSIRVFISGTFPDDCHFLVERLDIIVPPLPGQPPLIRLVVDDGSCLGRPCVEVAVLWHAAITLPPLPVGSYALPVSLEVTHCNEPPADSVATTHVPFAVIENCGTTERCLFPSWSHGEFRGPCNAVVGPGRPAEVDLLLRTPVALAGLQGELTLWPTGLVIRDLTAIGPASGMRLAWTRTESGARFVMFAENGAPIPATDDSEPPVEVLRVAVEQPPGTVPPSVTYLDAATLLGADADGEGVPKCLIITLEIQGARICALRLCDWNLDGISDVRDLVGMVGCLNDSTRCAGGLERTDCNTDGQFTLDDVICCARRILGGERPDSTDARPEPAVSVRFEPLESGDGLSLRLCIDGANRLGAALLGLAFPTDRYRLTGVESANGDGRWICLSEATAAGARLGAIALTPAPEGDPDRPFELLLRFARNGDGASGPGGGTVRVADGQFAGPDGALLEVALGSPMATLDPGPQVEFAAPEPNPSTGSTRFVLHLPAPDDVALAVYDVSGRLVATLHSGRLPAGTHPFVWNGRRTDGTAAGSGIYFARASWSAGAISHRIALLRNQ